jgi:FtsP/CotA-like multicopper oxidase with cupredoxin domain
VGDTEIWEIINISADAHPMHTHLTSFQVINRQAFKAAKYIAAYDGARFLMGKTDGKGPPYDYSTANMDGAIGGNPSVGPFLKGSPKAPNAYEMGWKDTVIAYPGEVTRIVVRWDTTDTPPAVTPAAAVGTSNYPFDPTTTIGGVGYVWHCHIVDHEDNEMMRNYVVGEVRQPVTTGGAW